MSVFGRGDAEMEGLDIVGRRLMPMRTINSSCSPDRKSRPRLSWRHCGRSQCCVDFCRHELRPMFFGFAGAQCGLQIQINECLVKAEGTERHKQETLNCIGVVLHHMVSV